MYIYPKVFGGWKMKTYTIKPIKWERTIYKGLDGDEITYSFRSIFGSMEVLKYPSKLSSEYGWDTPIQFKYCFDEYYDEGYEHYSTVKEAKEQANKFYLERLLPALKECK